MLLEVEVTNETLLLISHHLLCLVSHTAKTTLFNNKHDKDALDFYADTCYKNLFTRDSLRASAPHRAFQKTIPCHFVLAATVKVAF